MGIEGGQAVVGVGEKVVLDVLLHFSPSLLVCLRVVVVSLFLSLFFLLLFSFSKKS